MTIMPHATRTPETELKIETLVAVNAIITLGDRVLITRRSAHIREPLKWCIPGGHVEPGETWREAIAREVHEEIGLTIVESELIGVYSDPALTVTPAPIRCEAGVDVFGHFLVALFLVSAYKGTLSPNDEVGSWGWFERNGLPNPMIRSHPIRIEDYYENRRAVIR